MSTNKIISQQSFYLFEKWFLFSMGGYIQITGSCWPEVMYRCNGSSFWSHNAGGTRFMWYSIMLHALRYLQALLKVQKLSRLALWIPQLTALNMISSNWGRLIWVSRAHLNACASSSMLTAYLCKLIPHAACLTPPSFIGLWPYTGTSQITEKRERTFYILHNSINLANCCI